MAFGDCRSKNVDGAFMLDRERLTSFHYIC